MLRRAGFLEEDLRLLGRLHADRDDGRKKPAQAELARTLQSQIQRPSIGQEGQVWR